VVSPWSTGGYVCSEVFDHTSIIRFMESRFGVRESNISPWRRAICGDLTSAFDFGLTREEPARLPDTGGYQPTDKNRHNSFVPVPPANQALPKQERGSRPARPLAYVPLVDAAVTSAQGHIALTFSGGAAAGACFHVTAGNRADGPWSYTAEAGRKISGSWDTAATHGAYDLTVHGPNGFLRAFEGSAAHTGAEVTARHDGGAGQVELTFTNSGSGTVRFTVRNSYDGRQETYSVRAGRHETHAVDLGRSGHWYDLTVRSDHDSAFLRRFAGHVETGRPGISDPAIMTN
jgi:phospholipase C